MHTATSTPAKKRRRGPAPKPESEQRHHRIGVYLSSAERQTLIDHAFPEGTDKRTPREIERGLARYIRELALGTPPPSIPALNRDAWASLARVAANLNQSVKVAHTATDDELAGAAAEVLQQVQALRHALIGLDPDQDQEVPDES